MKEEFIKSLQMIKLLGIKNEDQYDRLTRDYLILSSHSLKYISQKNSFKEIIKLAEEL